MSTVKFAILGTGNIAHKMAVAMAHTPQASAYAVASRDEERAKAFATEHGISVSYDSYEKALADEAVDVVYIALPHPFHYEWIKKSLLADKHVLCEKPMTVNAQEAEELFALAAERNRFLCEAMWTRFLPAVSTVQALLADGCIGKPQSLAGSIGYDSTTVRRMVDPALGGGILLDCGIYLLTSMALLFGENIAAIDTHAVLSAQGVDLRSRTVFHFADGKTARLDMAMDRLLDNRIVICGERGTIAFDTPFHWENITVTVDDVVTTIPLPPDRAGGWEYMLGGVCDAVSGGEIVCKTVSPQATLTVMRWMDDLRGRWGLRYPFE